MHFHVYEIIKVNIFIVYNVENVLEKDIGLPLIAFLTEYYGKLRFCI